MKDPQEMPQELDPKVARFIEGRAKNVPFATLSQELGCSMRTLFRWSRLHRPQIQSLRAAEAERLAQQEGLSHALFVKDLADNFRRVREELKKRNLSDLSTAKLFELENQLRAEAVKHLGPLKLSEPISEADVQEENLPDPAISWED